MKFNQDLYNKMRVDKEVSHISDEDLKKNGYSMGTIKN